jgi:predicted ATPase/ankyrin repeat protein
MRVFQQDELFTQGQLALRDHILDLTLPEKVEVFEIAAQIRGKLLSDGLRDLSKFSLQIRECLKQVAPPQSLLYASVTPENCLLTEAEHNPFARLDSLTQELVAIKQRVAEEIAHQTEYQGEPSQNHRELYKLRFQELNNIQELFDALLAHYVAFKTALQDTSLPESERAILLQGRPIIVGLGFPGMYLDPDKAEKIINGDRMGACSHIVVRVVEVFYKQDPHGTQYEYFVDNLSSLVNGQGSTPTTLAKIYLGQKTILIQASKAVNGPLVDDALKCELVYMPSPPDANNLQHIPSKACAIYVYNKDGLYYINKHSQECIRIELDDRNRESIALFEGKFTPTLTPLALSVEQLTEIHRLLGSPLRCELIYTEIKPAADNLAALPFTSNTAYVICGEHLFFVNKIKKSCIAIKTDLKEFNKRFRGNKKATSNRLSFTKLTEMIAFIGEDHGELLACELLSVPSEEALAQVNQLALKTNMAYVRCQGKLFFINKEEQVCVEINPVLQRLECIFNLEDVKRQELSVEQTKEIFAVSGHQHSLEALENRVDSESFSAQIGVDLLVKPGDKKPQNMILPGAIFDIDKDVTLLLNSFARVKGGKHLPVVKSVLYCWKSLMEKPFDPGLRERYTRHSAAMIVMQSLINSNAQNQLYLKQREEGFLSEEEFRTLKLPILFVPGTIKRLYTNLLKMIEWCRGNEVTNDQLFKHLDPRLHRFYQYARTLSDNPREAYCLAFGESALTIEEIDALKDMDLSDCNDGFYDFEDKRTQSVESAVGELMSTVKFSELRGRSLIAGEESERIQFLKLLKSFPLRSMTIQDNDFLTDEFLQQDKTPWPASLEELKLVGCHNVTAVGLQKIAYAAANLKLVITNCDELATDRWPVELARICRGELTWILADGYHLQYPRIPGKHPLHQVVRDGSKEGMRIVLASGGSLTSRNEQGEPPFFEALRAKNNVTIFQSLLDSGYEFDLELARHDGLTLFHFAALQGNLEILEKIACHIRLGSLLQQHDRQGQTALHHAAAQGHTAVVAWLLEKGADVNATSANGTALSQAIRHNHLATVQLLLSHAPQETIPAAILSVQARQSTELRSECQLLREGKTRTTVITELLHHALDTLSELTNLEHAKDCEFLIKELGKTTLIHALISQKDDATLAALKLSRSGYKSLKKVTGNRALVETLLQYSLQQTEANRQKSPPVQAAEALSLRLGVEPVIHLLTEPAEDESLASAIQSAGKKIVLEQYLLACARFRKIQGHNAVIHLPNSAATLDANAKELAALGDVATDMPAAFYLYAQAFALDPTQSQVKLALGRVAYTLGHFELAVELLSDALGTQENDHRKLVAIESDIVCKVLLKRLRLDAKAIQFDASRVLTLATEMQDETSIRDLHPCLRQLLTSWFEQIYNQRGDGNGEKMLEDLRRDVAPSFIPLLDKFLKQKQIIVTSNEIYGREKEFQVIQHAFSAVCRGSSTLLLVSGPEGSGKTDLIRKGLQPHALRKGRFLYGKCDQFVKHPFTVIAGALNSLVTQLLKESAGKEMWREKIMSALAPNTHMLLTLVPALAKITGEVKAVHEASSENDKFLFEQLFIGLLHLFNRADCPLVIFLDDLQWADPESLNLILELFSMQTSSNNYLMVVGTYRDNEVDDQHPLAVMKSELKKHQKTVEEVPLKPLLPEQMKALVAGVLAWDPHQRPEALAFVATKVSELTAGNPYYAQQLLEAMKLNGYLQQEKPGAWALIPEKLTSVPTTIATILVQRLSLLNPEQRELISYAACLGSTLDLETLALILPKFKTVIAELVKQIATRDLLSILDGEYHFVHDSVQQEARALDCSLPQQLARHFDIGKKLLTKPNISKDEIVIAMGHVNKGLSTVRERLTLKEQREFAIQNLEAGLKAREATAFSTAFQFLETGISLMKNQPDAWEKASPIMFGLYKTAIDCAYISGNSKIADQLFEVAMANTTAPIEKADLYLCQSKAYERRANYTAALQAGREALRILGEEIDPENMKQHKIEFLFNRLSPSFGKIDKKAIAAMDKSSNKTELDLVTEMKKRIYSQMRISANLSNKTALYANLLIRNVKLILKQDNRSARSIGSVFSAFPAVLTFLGKYEQAIECDNRSLKFIKDNNNIEAMPVAYFVSAAFVQVWNLPIPKLRERLAEGREAGLRTGQLTFVIFCIVLDIYYSALEESIPATRALCEKYDNLIQKSQDRTMMLGIQIFKETSHILTDDNAYAAAPDIDHWEKMIKDNKGLLNFSTSIFSTWFIQGHTAALLELAQRLIKEAKESANTPTIAIIKFYAYLSALKQGGKNPLCSNKEFFEILNNGVHHSVEFRFFYNLSHAEKAAATYRNLSANKRKPADLAQIELHYRDAINSAEVEKAWVSVKAIAIELFAQFYEAIGDNAKAAIQWTAALDAYSEFGATAKVACLKLAQPLSKSTATPAVLHDPKSPRAPSKEWHTPTATRKPGTSQIGLLGVRRSKDVTAGASLPLDAPESPPSDEVSPEAARGTEKSGHK